MLYQRALLEAMQEAVFILDRQRRVIASNAAAHDMFRADAVTGRDFVHVTRDPDALRAIAQVLDRGRQDDSADELRVERELTLEGITPTRLKMRVSHLGFDNVDDALAAVTFTDISEMSEARQMRTDFVANVSHELRSPLTTISGFIETLRTSARGDADAQDRFLGLMEVETRRMVRLIADLLSLSKVQSRQRQRPSGRVDMEAVVGRIAANLEKAARAENKKLSINNAATSTIVPGDSDELTQVFQNLIENAIKYGRPGTCVSISMLEQERVPGVMGPVLTITVSDESDGIGQEHIGRLTERFYRVDTHRSRNKGGTGLGLAIVKHIVNRHRGRLRIESEAGKGSTFSVHLPAR